MLLVARIKEAFALQRVSAVSECLVVNEQPAHMRRDPLWRSSPPQARHTDAGLLLRCGGVSVETLTVTLNVVLSTGECR